MKLPSQLPKNKEVKINTLNWTYREYGSGYPVICLPAWMTTSFVFYPLSQEIEHKIKLVCPDMPGWTGKIKSNENYNNIDIYTDLMADFINKMNFIEFSLLGYSYGGVVLQNLLSKKLVKPQKNILVSTLNGGLDIFDRRDIKYLIKSAPAIRKIINNEDAIKRAYVFIRKAYVGFSYLSNSNLLYVDMLLKDIGDISIDNALSSIYSLYGRTTLHPNLKGNDILLLRSEKDYPPVIKGMTDISKFIGVRVNVIHGLNHHHLVFKPSASKNFILEYLNEFI